jgi:hypothetical protein
MIAPIHLWKAQETTYSVLIKETCVNNPCSVPMKIYRNLKSIIKTTIGQTWSLTSLACLIFTAGVGIAQASYVEFDSFDNPAEVSPFTFNDSNGVSAATNEWSSEDSQGLPWSGSMKVTIGYTAKAQGALYQYNLPGGATNLSGYTALEFDFKIDPATVPDKYGSGTDLQPGVATVNSGYNTVYMSMNLVTTNDGWQHVIVPASQLDGAHWYELTGVIFQIADYNETNAATAIVYIDNVQFTSNGPNYMNYTNATFQFDDSNSVASIYGDQSGNWYSVAAPTVTWSTNDSKGYTNSGSMYISAPFENGNNIILGIPFDTNYAAVGYGTTDTNAVINALHYTNIEMDVLWDTNNSTIEIDTFNAAGDIDGFPVGLLANPGAAQLEACGSTTTFLPDAASNSWQHLNFPITAASISADQTIGLWFKKYYGGTENGIAAFWVDNVTFDGAVIPPPTAEYPTLTMAKTVPGIQLQFTGGTSGNSEYSREHLATGSGSYSFVGASSPVTYSVTYASIPPAVPPQTYACVDFDPTGGTTTEEDWVDPTLFRIQIVRNTNVSGFGSSVGSLVTLECKTNTADGNGDLYDASDPSWTNASNPEGTWTFTISGNTSIQITAPDNETKTLPFPLGFTSAQVADPSFFGTGLMYVYFGAQGNGANGEGSRYVMSACSISGGGLTGFTENFAAEAAAGDPGPQGTVASPGGSGSTWTPVIAGSGANAITWYVGDDTSQTYPIVQQGTAGALSRSLYLIGASTPLRLTWTGNVAPGFLVLTNTSLTAGDFGSNADLTTDAYLDATYYSADVSTNDLPPVGGPNWFVELQQ